MFKLFDLPVLVVVKVFELTTPQELTAISFCSKKSKFLVKTLRKKLPKSDIAMISGVTFRVGFEIDGKMFEILRVVLREDDVPQEHISIDNHFVPVKIEDDGCIRTFWNDRETGLKCIMEYLTDLFKSDVTKLSIGNQPWIIEYMKNYYLENNITSPLKTLYLETKEIMDDNSLTDVLTTLTVSDRCSIIGRPSETFRYSGSFKPFNTFYVKFGFWVSIENLISLDCDTVMIQNSRIQSAEMNRFLKNWISGGSARLKWFNIEMDVIDVEVILSDLTVDRVDANVVRQYVKPKINTIRFQGGYDIQNEAGVTVTVATDQKTNLYIFVWPDSAGNRGAL